MGTMRASRRQSSRKFLLRLSVLLIWPLTVNVGCGGESSAVDAAGSADLAGLVDSVEAAKGDCEAKNTDCTKAYWTNAATCVVEARLGESCGSGAPECRGTCDADGLCVGPGAQKACGNGAPECSRCNGKGACSFYIPGAACKYPNPQECSKKEGTCAKFGVCVPVIDVGAACQANASPCGVGNCDAAGSCIPSEVGGPCPVANPSSCSEAIGICSANGACSAVAKPVGSPCPSASPSTCFESTGTCNASGSCEPVPKPVGAVCEYGASSECLYGTGSCTADGVCTAVFKTKGTPCGAATSTGCGTACDGAGQCLPNPGADCTVPDGICALQPGVCNANGYCAASMPCGKELLPQACGDFALGKSCEKTYKFSMSPLNCSPVTGSPKANSNSCGDAGDPCQPKMCSDVADSPSMCTGSQLPDGAPCPGVAANPCSAAKCLSGKCQAALKPAGTPCAPVAPKQCGPHACTAAGECAPVVPPVPLAGACTLSDGDSDCWMTSCAGAGTCKKVPRPAGEHCGAVADDACSAHRCDGKGWCVLQLTSEKDLCQHSDCLLPTANLNSTCPVGPCVESGCKKLGQCQTTYKAAGTSCTVEAVAGICDESHRCIPVGKGSEWLVGQPCMGQFPCMKEGVAYGEDGTCHGTIAVGEICGTPCKPGICGADGTCQNSLAPKGTACRKTALCGNFECDGKGECAMPAGATGKSCGASYLDKLAECQHYSCAPDGECVPTAAVGKACASSDPCTVGTCGPGGTCELQPISGPVCSLAKPDACHSGVCKAGKCEPVAQPGGACGEETACMAYQCDAKGQCAGVPKPGASCESTGNCTKGVCDLAGQCTQVLDPGGTCTGKDQCSDGVCDGAGACQFSPKAAGSPCIAVAPGTNWDCYTGACDGKGGCALKVNTGAPCKDGDSPCTAGVCQSDASCKAIPANLGKPCANQCASNAVCGPTGKCQGAPLAGKDCYAECLSSATCSAQGECVGTAKVGYACGSGSHGQACSANACNSLGKCVKQNSPAGNPCDVGAALIPDHPTYPCGSAKGNCNGSGVCVPLSVNPDGTPCGADDGCAAAHVCKGGLCLPQQPKANGTPCQFGCAPGTCAAGACMAFTSINLVDNGPCADGNLCTYSTCIGAPLPGLVALGFIASPEWAAVNAGKCFQEWQYNVCPDGKQPDPNSCKFVPCPLNDCGSPMVCNLLQNNGNGICVTPVGPPGQGTPACKKGNPCVTVGCGNGDCVYTPVWNSTPCGAFKHCQDGECVEVK